MRRNESPRRRVNPNGGVVWRAAWTDEHGKVRYSGAFEKKGPCREPAADSSCCAQHRIWAMYQAPAVRAGTIREYALGSDTRKAWLDRHPRSARTNDTYMQKVKGALEIPIAGKRLGEYTWDELRRRHVTELISHMFEKEGRSRNGVLSVLRPLSTMASDAIDDEECEDNRFLNHRIRKNDPRIRKGSRQITVVDFDTMHGFAWVASQLKLSGNPKRVELDKWRAVYAEPMLRMFSDCGPRLGEVLPLTRADIVRGPCPYSIAGHACPETSPHVHFQRTAWKGKVLKGTKTDHGEAMPGRAVPLSVELDQMLRDLPARLDTPLLFPTPTGSLWLTENWRRSVWDATVNATGVWVTPHDFRHSWISELRAAGVDPADLAQAAGHSVQTQHARYTHSMGRSFEGMREAVRSVVARRHEKQDERRGES